MRRRLLPARFGLRLLCDVSGLLRHSLPPLRPIRRLIGRPLLCPCQLQRCRGFGPLFPGLIGRPGGGGLIGLQPSELGRVGVVLLLQVLELPALRLCLVVQIGDRPIRLLQLPPQGLYLRLQRLLLLCVGQGGNPRARRAGCRGRPLQLPSHSVRLGLQRRLLRVRVGMLCHGRAVGGGRRMLPGGLRRFHRQHRHLRELPPYTVRVPEGHDEQTHHAGDRSHACKKKAEHLVCLSEVALTAG